jgi:hypothetical protein
MSSYVERPLHVLAAANPVPDSMQEELTREAAVLFPSLFERVSREKQTLAPASRFRRRPLLVVAMALLLLAAIVAPALAFRAQIVDFFTASHASKNVVVDFKQLQVEQRIADRAFPAVLSGRARRITNGRVNGTRSVLYVAPTKNGGFCAFWSPNEAPRCYAHPSKRGGLPKLGGLRFAEMTYSAMNPPLGVDTVSGVVYARGAAVELRYANGTETAIPYVWVTAPINAGFFIYGVPSNQRVGNARPVALIVTRGGETLTRQPIENVSTNPQTLAGQGLVDRRDRWGMSIQAPTEAIWSKRRMIYSFLLSDGELIEFWVTPSRKSVDRRCYVGSALETGCEPAVLAGPPVQLQLPTGFGSGGGGEVHEALLWGRVAARVERVELKFEDGTQQAATPRDGFLIAKISLAHSRPGHRLVRAVGVDRSGHVVGVDDYNPATPGVYPCRKPKDYGYGVTRCP